MTLDTLRTLWREDWQAMKAGTYVAPLPHPSRMYCREGRYEAATKFSEWYDGMSDDQRTEYHRRRTSHLKKD